MKPLLLLLIYFNIYSGFCQSKNNDIVIGKRIHIFSKIMNRNMEAWVYVPDFYSHESYQFQKFPVVYLLDGDEHFYSVSGMIRQFSEMNGNTVCPEMIVVGILNPDREYDLTPVRAGNVKNTGGGEDFTSFIKNELIPYIDQHKPTEPNPKLIGQSLGGLLVINTLLMHPEMFNSYVAVDPSLWYDNLLMIRKAVEMIKDENWKGKTLFIINANTLNPGMDTVNIRNDTSRVTLQIRTGLMFADILKENSHDGFAWKYKYYPDESHVSVPLVAEIDAIKFIFSYYPLPKNYMECSCRLDSLINEHFKMISEHMGFKVLPPEPYVDMRGFLSMGYKKKIDAAMLFRMNVENYPESVHALIRIGEFYESQHDNKLAVQYYTKALSIREIPSIREKLNELKGG